MYRFFNNDILDREELRREKMEYLFNLGFNENEIKIGIANRSLPSSVVNLEG